MLNDFMHFVVILVLRRKHECGCHDSLIDTRVFLFLFFPCTIYHPYEAVIVRCVSGSGTKLLFHQ